ncbi:MAG: flagellar basal body rod protein FlgB [Desulfovermiculus sp.]
MADEIALFGQSYQVLEKSLDLRKKNHQYLASNIANAQTPGYSPSHLNFEGQLQAAISGQGEMRATDDNHFGLGSGGVQDVEGNLVTRDRSGIADENGVRMQEEMSLLSQNQHKYETAAKMLRGKFSLMQYVIQQGK